MVQESEKKSTLVQIMNEVVDLNENEKKYLLYWLRAKKNEQATLQSDSSIKPNNVSLEDIYAERDAIRNAKQQ